jgi:hypothetical protein
MLKSLAHEQVVLIHDFIWCIIVCMALKLSPLLLSTCVIPYALAIGTYPFHLSVVILADLLVLSMKMSCRDLAEKSAIRMAYIPLTFPSPVSCTDFFFLVS